MTGGPTRQGFKHLLDFLFFFLKPAASSDLNEALNHFYKFGENSQRLPITFSTSTKIWCGQIKSFEQHLFIELNKAIFYNFQNVFNWSN